MSDRGGAALKMHRLFNEYYERFGAAEKLLPDYSPELLRHAIDVGKSADELLKEAKDNSQ